MRSHLWGGLALLLMACPGPEVMDGGTAGGTASGGGSAGGSAGGTAGGSAGGTAGGSAGGAAGGSAGGAAGGSAGGAAGGSAGGAAGGSAGGAAGGSAGGAAGGSAGGSAGGAAGGSAGGSGGGTVTLAGGETCADATLLLGSASVSSTTAGMTNDYRFAGSSFCQGQSTAGAGAPDTVYAVPVPSGNRLTAVLTASWDAVLNVFRAPPSNCGTVWPDGGTLGPDGGTSNASCLFGVNQGTSGRELIELENLDAGTTTYYLSIDGFTGFALGAFNLSVDVYPFPPGDFCADPQGVILPATFTGETFVRYGRDIGEGEGCAGVTSAQSHDRFYQVSVPPGHRLTAVATPELQADGGVVDLRLSVMEQGCPQTQPFAVTAKCTLASDGVGRGAVETIQWDNPSGTARDVLLLVDTRDVLPTATFRLDVSSAPVSFLPGESCTAAPPVISASTLLPAESLAGYANNYASPFCLYAPGPDRSYLVDVAAGQILHVVATPAPLLDAGLDLTLVLVSSAEVCPNPCLSASDVGDPRAEESLTYVSPDGGPQQVRVVVDSFGTPPGATYALEVSLGPPVGDTCATAGPAITSDTALSSLSLIGYANDYPSSSCGFGLGVDRVFAVSVPAMTRVSVGAASTANLELGLVDGLASCTSPPTCVAQGASAGIGRNEWFSYVNPTAATKNMFIVVDRATSGGTSNETFGVKVVYGTPSVGDTCASPTPLVASGVTLHQTTLGYTNNYAPVVGGACASRNTQRGLERVYSVTLAVGQRLGVTVDPGHDDDAALYLIRDLASLCTAAPTACIAEADAVGTGLAETLTYTNNTAAARTVYLVVDGPGLDVPLFDYSITVDLSP